MPSSIRVLFIILGSLCIALAFIGLLLPVLPTTPFLLLAAYFFARSSDKFYHWLIENRWFGPYIRSYREGRGMCLRDKLITLILLWLTIGATILFTNLHAWIDLLLFAIPLGVSTHILRIPTAPPGANPALPVSGVSLNGDNDLAA